MAYEELRKLLRAAGDPLHVQAAAAIDHLSETIAVLVASRDRKIKRAYAKGRKKATK